MTFKYEVLKVNLKETYLGPKTYSINSLFSLVYAALLSYGLIKRFSFTVETRNY